MKKKSKEIFYTSECYFTSKDCKYHEEDAPFGSCPLDNEELMKKCPCKKLSQNRCKNATQKRT